jgi:hypothetical protein
MGKVTWPKMGVLPLALAVMLMMAPVVPAIADDNRTILFVCQHGVVNSQMAAAYFNNIAKERGLPFTAISRGIDGTYSSVPVRIADGLALDGLTPVNTPQVLTAADADGASRVLAFDEIPTGQRGNASVTYWQGIALGVNDYEAARDEIVRRIDALVPALENEKAK